MAYRYGDRSQLTMFPQSIEEYVAEDDPVRAYDAFVNALKMEELGMVIDETQLGNSEYDPQAMIKLLVYGYSYGTQSSRKLERATHHNVSFMWLMGGLKPDHKTIARFRKENRESLKNVMKQSAKMCIKLGLIDGNTLFVDGSKIRANASINNTWTMERCEKRIKKIEENIEAIIKESEKIDEEESGAESLVKMKEELKGKEKLKAKIEVVMEEIRNEGKTSINTTDRGCVKVKGRQGTHAGYNGQIVVDEKHGLIVHSDVVNESNDRNQFARQMEEAVKTVDNKCKNACGDAGYADIEEMKKIHDKNINVIVPSQEQVEKEGSGPFGKDKFQYDSKKDCYICAEGQVLTWHGSYEEKNCEVYRPSRKKACIECKHFGVCTRSPRGRTIKRLKNEELKTLLEERYKTKESEDIFRLRKEKVELPFGHIKRNLGVSGFLLRGLEGVRAEMALFASCFNMARMISIMGVRGLVTKLG